MAGTVFDDKIMDQLKTAMREKDSLAANTLRAMKSALKYKMVENKSDSLGDAEAMSVFRSLIKQRMEAIEQYDKSGMTEAAEKERKEAAIIQSFLPEPLSEKELEEIVSAAIRETGASSMKDMGTVMKLANEKAANRADGRMLSQMVKSKLS